MIKNEMQTTGIVRRMDDLGRIVIPKEIRKRLDMRDGNPYEVFLCEDGLFIKPYKITVDAKNRLIEVQHDLWDSEPEIARELGKIIHRL